MHDRLLVPRLREAPTLKGSEIAVDAVRVADGGCYMHRFTAGYRLAEARLWRCTGENWSVPPVLDWFRGDDESEVMFLDLNAACH